MDIVEGHPIPQDITGFQFKLIGEMTVKQFAYLAAGLVLGWIAFSLPIFLFIRVPFALIFVGLGASFAFLPIQGRPADTMLLLFIKAIIKPNEYSYKKSSLKQDAPITTPAPDIIKPPASMPPVVIPEPEPPTTTPNNEEPLPLRDSTDKDEIIKAEMQEQSPPPNSTDLLDLKKKIEDLQVQLQESLSQKQQLENKIVTIEKKDIVEKKEPQLAQEPIRPPEPTKIAIPGAPFVPDVPNLITGIVKDPTGRVIPNVLVEIKDLEENPVRAFKTNPLGQFASATPLLNGEYTVTFEDAKKEHEFKNIKISAIGEVIYPLEVIAIDKRELLRKELFST